MEQEPPFVLIPPWVRHTFLNIHAPAGFDRRLMEPDD
jgi:hypothetical protein